MAAAVWAFLLSMAVVNLLAQEDSPLRPQPGWLDKWLTPQNIVTGVVLVYGFGVLREQFAETRRQVAELRDTVKQVVESADETYVRKDVADTRFRELSNRIDGMATARRPH